MDSVHDIGGTDNIGSIDTSEENSKSFDVKDSDWEEAVFPLLPALYGQRIFNFNTNRYTIEKVMDPVYYLDAPYYEHWLAGIEAMLYEQGIITKEEYQTRINEFKQAENPEELIPKYENEEIKQAAIDVIENGTSERWRQETDPKDTKFKPGDEVVVKNTHPTGHSRCPGYIRGKKGVIEEIFGTQTLPDKRAHVDGFGEYTTPEPVYHVKFDNEDIWGEDYEHLGGNETTVISLYETYLEGVE